MEISDGLFDLQQPLPKQALSVDDHDYIYNEMTSSYLDQWQEHPLMAIIRDDITTYRLQSAAHFDVLLEAKQALALDEDKMTRSTRLKVSFVSFDKTHHLVCRPVFRRHLRKKTHTYAKRVQVENDGQFVPLAEFLDSKYPCHPDFMHAYHMQKWWAANDKVFDWAGLPTELKGVIIQSCVDQRPEPDDIPRAKERFGGRPGKIIRRGRNSGIQEVVEKLTKWRALLGVSHQVRAITLRICFFGSDNHPGFGITAYSRSALNGTLEHLGTYYQMTEPNALPVDHETWVLAESYNHYPRIFPHLKQYATFRHGLRRICLNMGFVNYMHFFKVTIGSFGRYLHPQTISHEIFEQLPHLSDIIIRLPRQPRRGWENNQIQQSPRLFFEGFPCPRLLHRVIYERIAETLTIYPCVDVEGFVDDDEKVRFVALRASALERPTWTRAEYQQLYAECGGGIQLQKSIQLGDGSRWTDEDLEKNEVTVKTEDSFFPPKCRCVEQCYKVFTTKEKKRGR
jgi:hypothetical protein